MSAIQLSNDRRVGEKIYNLQNPIEAAHVFLFPNFMALNL